MLIKMAILGIIIICIVSYAHFIITEKRKKELITSNEIINLETLVGFSNADLVKRLKKYYKNNNVEVLVEYADNKYLVLDTGETEERLCKLLEEKQLFMIKKRYEPESEYVVKDSINNIMHDIWLDYAYKQNYEEVFWREVRRRVDEDKISTSSYNEIYRRFYKYKFNN